MPTMLRVLLLVALSACCTSVAFASEDQPKTFEAPGKVKPGTTGLLTSKEKGMRYFLRVPKKYDAKSGARLIVFLHGSNMNGLDYLRSFEAMNWADVFLHASVSEGFCNAVLEAQAMRLPVVTSDADGLPENVDDGRTGFVVPRRDPAALAEKLAVLAGDAALRREMGEAGRARVEHCFSLPRQIADFDRFYREMNERHAH